MSGLLFDDVGPITLEEWNDIKKDVYAMLSRAGVLEVEPVGSTGLKEVMGDIDLAVMHAENRQGLIRDLGGRFDLRKVGNDLVSIKYPLKGGRWVQIDLMEGNIDFLRWSRVGSTIDGIKNSCRAVLLNLILRFASERIPPEPQPEWERIRYALDFGAGLYVIRQTRRSKTEKPLKEWKTTQRVFVTNKPDDIAEVMFGVGFTAAQLCSLDGVIRALRSSSLWAPEQCEAVLSTFREELHELAKNNPSAYGDLSVVDALLR